MRRSHLVIEGYYVKELTFAVTPKFEDNPEFESWVGFHFQPTRTYRPEPVMFDAFGNVFQHKRERNRWRYELQIKSHTSKKKNFPYTFDISLVGLFRIEGEHAQEHINLLLYANAPAVLYSAAREVLATATGRGPYPAIILPSVTFVDNIEQMAAELAKRVKPIEVKRIESKKAVRKAAKKGASKKK